MQVTYRYAGRSGIVNGLNEARMSFATNTLRESVAFGGSVAQPLLLREALATLYQVVVSDFKYRPRDRLAFRAWLAQQDQKFLQSLQIKTEKARKRIAEIETTLAVLDRKRDERLRPFAKARMEFFNYLYEQSYELAYLYDPVITVHPDELSFEAFSKDESSYARLAARFDMFDHIETKEYGTTNIDFSAKLHTELERIRTYRQTRFDVDPAGFAVTTGSGDTHHEKKIDLPESWVQGFHQVHSTMTLGLTRVNLAPVDLFNICRYLRRRKRIPEITDESGKSKRATRALRYEFTPGQPGRVVIEPWEAAIPLVGTPEFDGPKPLTFRTWGRYRLLTLARLLPLCQRVDLYLAGHGLPSVYILDLGPATFTLALSGWTDNDWTGGAKFDLLASRLSVLPSELMQIHDALKERRLSSDVGLAQATGLSVEKARSAMSYLCQVGRAMVDLAENVYRFRDLFGEPFGLAEAQKATALSVEANTPQEKLAIQMVERSQVRLTSRRPTVSGVVLTGLVKGDADSVPVRPSVEVDHDGKIITATCTCGYYRAHQLTRGPCEHILALRNLRLST